MGEKGSVVSAMKSDVTTVCCCGVVGLATDTEAGCVKVGGDLIPSVLKFRGLAGWCGEGISCCGDVCRMA